MQKDFFARLNAMPDNPNWQSAFARSQPAPVAKKGKPWYTALISELGGAGGAAGGAATGAAVGSVVPGVGTAIGGLAGAILGGFAGGTGGRIVENKVRDNRIGLGDALKEGTLMGALSGLGTGYQVLKGAKAVKGLAGVTAGTDVIPQVPAKIGGLEQAGRGMKASAMGFGQGTKLAGERLGAGQSDEVAQTLKTLNIKAGSPEAVQRAIENRLTNLDATLSAQYSKGKIALTPTELNGLKKTITQRIKDEVGSAGDKFARDRLAVMGTKKDTSSLWQFTKNLKRNHTNFGANTDAKLVDREAVARIIADEVKNFQNVKLPGVAATNSLYHQAKNADTLLKTAAADIKGGSVVGKITTLSPVRSAEAKLGAGLERAGRLSAGTGGPSTRITNQAKLQAPSALLDQSGIQQPSGAEVTPVDPLTAGLGSTQFGMGQTQQAQTPNPYPLERALADIKRDPKHSSDYLSIYKTVAAAEKSAKPGNNIGKVSAQNYSNAQSGYSALQQLSQLFQADPGVIQRSGTPGRSLPLVGGVIANRAGTTQMDALAANVADKYIRLTTGATANADEIKNLKTQMLPRPGDTPSQAQYKLKQFASLFESILQQAQGQDSNGSLIDALTQGATNAY